MNEVLRVLEEGRKIIADPSTFTTGSYARNSLGSAVTPFSDHAVRFCSIGAISVAAKGMSNDLYYEARDFMHDAAKALMGRANSITYINDTFPHEEVLEMWDLAIAAARKQIVVTP